MKTQQISLTSCYQAYQECRRYKRRKSGVLAYEARLLDELLAMRDALNTRRWLPSRSYCFVVTRPKAREIHAALFKDRVMHHWLVPRLEVLFEPVFIYDSYSNRQGKGTHKAVDRLQLFMKQVSAITASGMDCGALSRQSAHTGATEVALPKGVGNAENNQKTEIEPPSGTATSVAQERVPDFQSKANKTNINTRYKPNGYYLQLDIKNFFNRINRNILFQLLSKRINKSNRQGKITDEEGDTLLYLCYQLLRKHPATYTRYLGGKNRGKVPTYKRLINAPSQCGLPIGNLTSQFFANVYLNELDQFVKHQLKCKHYVRYVDDFVLLHEDKQQLLQWRSEIACFLHETLKLELKRLEPVKPLNQGVDFLGFITRPHYRLVRRRVVQHLRLQLKQFERKCIRQVVGEVADTASLLHLKVRYKEAMKLQSILASYLGHFKHANSERLVQKVWQEYTWLSLLFKRPVGSKRLIPVWNPKSVNSFFHQWNLFKRHYFKGEVEGLLFIQTGWKLSILVNPSAAEAIIAKCGVLSRQSSSTGATEVALPGKVERDRLFQCFRSLKIPYVYIVEQGYLRGGLKRRVLKEYFGGGAYV